MREKGIAPSGDIKDPEVLDRWLRRLQAAFPKVQTFTVTFNPASVAANTTSEQTVTVNGLDPQDIIMVTKPTHDAGLGIVNARASAANTLAITYQNTTGSAINPPEEDYLVASIRR